MLVSVFLARILITLFVPVRFADTKRVNMYETKNPQKWGLVG
jgi:hypothetical protein